MNPIYFESLDTFYLYQEFISIPDNPLSFTCPDGIVITTQIMYGLLRIAYKLVDEEVIAQ